MGVAAWRMVRWEPTNVLRSWAHLLASCLMDEWASGIRGFSKQANKAYNQRPCNQQTNVSELNHLCVFIMQKSIKIATKNKISASPYAPSDTI